MKNYILVCALCIINLAGSAASAAESDNGIWKDLEQRAQDQQDQKPWIQPTKFRLIALDNEKLETVLDQSDFLLNKTSSVTGPFILLPAPDGSYARFTFTESPIMEPGLADKYPEIKTYSGYQVDNPSITVRFDWTPEGFHAQVLSSEGAWYIDPYYKGYSYASYYKKDYQPSDKEFSCTTKDHHAETDLTGIFPKIAARSGDILRTYRLAVATTGEYGQYHGGTEAAMSAVSTTINRVTGIYEKEFSIRLTLVANNDQIIYADPTTDPFTGNNDAFTLLEESQDEIDSTIGDANYDIGHTFSTGAGGLAQVGAVCATDWKAQGVTGKSNPIGDPYDVDYVSHELGHQFSAYHTFNGATGSCSGGNRTGVTAYEPGSGSTIMGYAGICGEDNLQVNSDPIFHSASHDQILDYVTNGDGSTCGSTSSSGNSIPVVTAGSNFTIPANTPFVLTGAATDSDSDPLTYLWEERDLGPQAILAAADDGQIPLFRVFTPSSDPSRYFPKLSSITNGTSDDSEKLPQLSRTMAFRLTVRDGNGGVESDDMQITVDSSSGPFQVTTPNSSTSFNGNSSITVSWNIAGTDSSPVNASTVDIFLSTDGGMTWDLASPLVSGVTNDGSETVTLPNIDTTQARIMVKGHDNIFFDISDQDFTIIQQANTSTFVLAPILMLLL